MVFINKIQDFLKTSLWVIPGFMGMFAVLIFYLTLMVDIESLLIENIIEKSSINSQLLSLTVSTLLAAIVTVFGILLPMMVSIIMRASAQYTPIILRTYRTALPPKFFIGLILSTTIYLILSLLYLNFFEQTVVFLSIVIVDFFLITLSLFSIPPLLDYLVRNMEPTFLARKLLDELKKLVEKHDTKVENPNNLAISQDRSMLAKSSYNSFIQSEREGYLQSVDIKKLLSLANDEKLIVAIPYRVGEYINIDTGVIYVKSDREISEKTETKIRNCLMFGVERIDVNDLELQIDGLVYITLKALSPGVNDYSTALHCMSVIGSCCNTIGNHHFSNGVHRDGDGKARIYSKEFDYSGFIECAFDRLRIALKDHPKLVKFLLNIILELAINCQSRQRVKLLASIADKLIAETKSGCIESDVRGMESIQDKINSIF
ncbi:MAG: DUF2254 family protein [Chlamydiota bacterium]|nr:DUF2254 family protein [Chlamydiota bacterium]